MLTAGTIITLGQGQYRLCELLAASSYGVVWRAEGARPVALKLINRSLMERAADGQRERWVDSARNEIAFLQSLQAWDERHIVRLIDSGEHEGLPVLALELLDGDLAREVASARNTGNALPLAQVIDWLGQLNQALAKVHQYGWRYLDLKPANVLIDARRNAVKLADFGTNRLLDAPLHFYAGTPNWQAPEQFFPLQGEIFRTDARTDYFALGAIFYYLVTSGLPLRFCSECGQAYREHQSAAPDVVRARYQGAIPPTLREDEARLFAHRIEQQGMDSTPALALLRSLLQAQRGARPHNALDISRLLELAKPAPTPPLRAAPWQAWAA